MSKSNILKLLCFCLIPFFANCWVSENRRIEQEILRNYDRRHRPVRKESTVVRVQLYLTVNHIERVDELEGTMHLHGILWASWFDEYLRWTPADHNNTRGISIEAWKIWQPTFALYNSARSNSWFVYMNGVPATVSDDGRVFAAGTFSFQVTCQFDFSNYPYDMQECPIVLADWIYDLSKVNLSEAITSRSGLNTLAKPAIRLSFDPLSENVKKHVAGWEVIDTWQRLCYWGPNGYCIDQTPIGPLDNYWSLIEFGIKIRRHAPYYGLTLVLPIIVAISLTLLIFWIDNLSLAVSLCVFTLLLEAYSGLNLLQQLPPGDGVMPQIGVIHIWTVSLTLLALTAHCTFYFLLIVLPKETKFLPEQLSTVTTILRQYKFFHSEGLSFDPQTIMGFEPMANHIGYSGLEEEMNNPTSIVPDSLIIEMDPVESTNSISIQSPSTSQFQSIKLEENEQKSMDQSSSMTSRKSGIFSNVFGSKEEKNKGPVISSPFSGIFGSENILKKGNNAAVEEEKIIATEENGNYLQLLIDGNNEKLDGNGREKMPESKKGEEKNEERNEENGNEAHGNGKKGNEAKSPLESELAALRRLLFTFFLFASIILLIILIF